MHCQWQRVYLMIDRDTGKSAADAAFSKGEISREIPSLHTEDPLHQGRDRIHYPQI
jgi:hypothetical protein